MEPPIGFMTLYDAADKVGRKMHGSKWRPIVEIVSEITAAKRKETRRIKAINARLRTRFDVHKRVEPESAGLSFRALRATARTTMQAEAQAEAQYEAILLPEVDQVIKMLAEQFEAGKIHTAYRSIEGADPLDSTIWRRPNWRSYFATCKITLELPLLRNGRPNPDGKTAPCTREIFVRRDEVACLVATLKATQKHKGGAPIKYDWDDYKQRFMQLWQEKGDFRLQRDNGPGWNSKTAAASLVLDYIQTRIGPDDAQPHLKVVVREMTKWLVEIDSHGT